jgi:hypothetical protein
VRGSVPLASRASLDSNAAPAELTPLRNTPAKNALTVDREIKQASQSENQTMQAIASIRQRARLGYLLPLILTAGCGTGDGPTPIPGTPAPPPPPVTCDNINFEDGCGPFNFVDFGGGVTSIVANPQPAGLNTSAKVARMQKFAGEVFAGSALNLDSNLDFSKGQAFKMKVRAGRAVPVLFKLEGADSSSQTDDRERSVNYSGSGGWEQLCFDFTGDTAGLTSRTIAFIFDLGVSGNAASDPSNWTFFFDEIEQVADCGIPVVSFPVTFEGDPASYNFGVDGGFGGGASAVIANPDQSGLNVSAQVARMQKFAGEVFGGSTLTLSSAVNFPQGEAFKMKVWASRQVPVLFKFEGPDPSVQTDDRERTLSHSGSSTWEELCFDFRGDTAGLSSRAITFIFDLGVNGNAAADPDNWTFYYDDIEQVASCGGATGPVFPVDFEGDAAQFDFGTDGGFGGGVSTVVANPASGGINTSAQVARMQKFAGEVFGGSTLNLGGNVDFAQGEAFKMKVRATRAVPVLFKFEGLDEERSLNHSGSGNWEALCFDFTDSTAGPPSSAITFIFDLGVAGNAAADPANWTFYYDDIEQVASCDGGGGGTALGPVDFEPAGLGQGFTWGVFENGDNPAVAFLANPDPTGANTSATVARFTARQAGQPFAGTITTDLPTFTLDATNSCVKIKVWKTVISDVGIKFETADFASTGDIKVPNTVTNSWEELSFDFSGTIGQPASTDITGFVVFPDFAAREQENVVYFDDIRFLDSAQCVGGGGGGGGAPASVNFEGDPGQFDFGADGGFGGGVSTVIANPVPGGINTSAQVVRMQKFAGEVFGGSTLALPAGVDWSQGETFTMKVWSRRTVPVRFKLENNIEERDDTHDGGSQWQELCFDFTGTIDGAALTGISIFFDLGVAGDAAGDPDNWTFYYDDIEQSSAGCAPPPPPSFATITFDDPATTYTLTDFGGNLSTVTNDPAGGGNQVGQVVKPVGAELWAGTTVSTLPGDAVPRIPLDAANTKMSVRVYSPSAGTPIRLKIENAANSAISVETEALTTAINTWETLTFDFASPASGSPAFNAANTYDRISIFFNFGTTGAAAGEKTYYFDDVAVGAPTGGAGIIPEAVVYATDPSVVRDLAPPMIDNFGSGAVFDPVFAGDTDYNPAFRVTSGEGYGGGVHVGFVAFNGYAAGFAAGFGTFEFKAKVNAPGSASNFEVKFINGGDTSKTYDLTTYAGSTALGNGWYQVQIPMSDFAATSAANSGFLLGPLGGQAGAFTMLLTDIGFSGTAGGGGGAGIIPEAVVYATDPSVVRDLAPPMIDNFGSGAVFDPVFAGDTDYNPAFRVTSGEGYGGGVHVGFVAFNGYAAGFAAGFGTFEFKAKVNAPGSASNFEVKFINGGDTSKTYDLTTYAGSTALGNGWYQVQIPMSDFAATSAANSGFLLGPLGGQAGAFTMLLTDIGFSGTAGGGGGDELAVNGGFEAGDLSDWEVFPNGGSITVVDTDSSSGTYSVRVVAGPTQNPVLKQERRAAGTVNPGDTINISFDMKGSAVDGGVIFPELISEPEGPGQLLATIAAPTAGWTTYSYSATAGANVTEGITFQLAIVCGGAPSCSTSVFIDNVSVTIAP